MGLGLVHLALPLQLFLLLLLLDFHNQLSPNTITSMHLHAKSNIRYPKSKFTILLK
jgi:hypothetical protein